MKKILAFIVAALFAANSFAQGLSGTSIGVHFGFNPISYNPGGEYTPASLSGVGIEIAYEVPFIQNVGVSAGLRYSFQGIGDNAEILGVKTTWQRSFLQLPVKAVVHFNNFYINAGPTVSFWVANNYTESSSFGTIKKGVNKDEYNVVNVFLGGEVGYDFPFLRVFCGYDYGLRSMLKKNALNLQSYQHQLRFGVAFVL